MVAALVGDVLLLPVDGLCCGGDDGVGVDCSDGIGAGGRLNGR